MKNREHLVVVLDDESALRNSLKRLLTSQGYKVRLHQDPDGFFEEGLPDVPACLLLDNDLNHAKSGIEVHAEIRRRGWHLPTIFLTGHWNVQEVVSSIQAGADAFLTKPFEPEDLLAAVAAALERSQSTQVRRLLAADAIARAATLTKREREIVCYVVSGKLNKEIATVLSIALITVKVHRGRAMKKLGAGNAAELARIANLANLSH